MIHISAPCNNVGLAVVIIFI